MLTIKQDSEFMTNLLPANPIQPGKRFVAFKDEQGHPAVFALSADDKLNLFILQNGKYAFIEFSDLWMLPSAITSFDMRQFPDGSIYLAVASKSSETTSSVYVISDVKPADLVMPLMSKVHPAGSKYPSVYDIYISDFTQDINVAKIPMMFLSFAPANSVTQSSQLGYVEASVGGDGNLQFSLNTSWRLKTDPIKILSVAWATCQLGQGAIVLYESSTGLRIQFSVFRGNNFAVELKCPTKASSISAVFNAKTNASDMFVGGEQITYYAWRQYCTAFSPGTPLTSKAPLDINDVYAVQGSDSLAIWFATKKKAVQYYTASTASITSGEVIPLLPEGRSARISPILSQRSGSAAVDSLVSVDDQGQLSLLECPQETGMWQSVPLYSPSPKNNLEVPSFTLRFRVVSDNDDQPTTSCQLLLVCSGVVSAQNNGKQVTIDPEGSWLEADEDGVLSIIVSTHDAAAYEFHAEKYKGPSGGEVKLDSWVLNPNAKLNEKLTVIQNGTDLLNAKTQTGEDLIKKGSIDQTTANEAADMLVELNKQQIVMGQPSTELRKRKNVPRLHNPLAETPRILAGHLPEHPDDRAQLLERLKVASPFNNWSFFHWVKDKAHDATTWFLDAIGDVVTFVVTIGQDIFKFLLDSVEAIGKAVTWVFEKVKVGLQKLIDFLGFLFSWDDILVMADNISIYFNTVTDYSQDRIQYMKGLKAQWLKSLKSGVADKEQPTHANSGPDANIPDNQKNLDETKDSVSYNWVGSRIKESGMDSQSSVAESKQLNADDANEPSLEQLWEDVQKIFFTLKQTAIDVGSNIKDLFSPGTSSTTVFARMKDSFINNMLDQADNVADLLLDAIALILKKLKDFLNAEVQMPIFSKLWSVITGGKLKFTVLNALSLMLAVPSTILYKLIERKAPPSLKGLTPAAFGDYLSGKSLVGDGEEVQLPISRRLFFVIEGVIGAHCLLLLPLFEQVKKLADWFSNKPNLVDGGMLVFGCVMVFIGWPKAGSNDMSLRYAVWGLEISNTVALGLSCFARWKSAKLSREVAVKALSIWEVLTGIPRFVLRIIIIIRGYAADLSALIRYTIEDTLAICKSIAKAIGELVDEPDIKATAKIVYYGTFAVYVIAKIVSVNVEAKDPPSEWGPFPAGIEWHKALMLATANLDQVWESTAIPLDEARARIQDKHAAPQALQDAPRSGQPDVVWDIKLVPVTTEMEILPVD